MADGARAHRGPQRPGSRGVVPVIDPSAYVHPSAVLIGDVWIGAGCYVGAGAVFRGDFGRIELQADANVQDNCVVHSLPDFDCVMQARSHIGHGAVIHGCRIGAGALIGMNAVILDKAVVGENALVAAMALVKIAQVIPPAVMVAGVPAKVVRALNEEDLAWKRLGTDWYIALAHRARLGSGPVQALEKADSERLAQRTAWR
ncbi:MAG: phenylacetic acid degradation protein PaaY [Betaproteobacteria bacterium]|nr:phenylacetic acid degradation protein PaaY [Betaproteobacteria bacterium]